MNWKIPVVLTCLLLSVLVVVFVSAVEPSSSSHRINDTQTKTYLEHNEAIKVTNSCGKDMFIPANTLAEWSDFNNSAPSCATLDNDFIECDTSAGGTGCSGGELARGSNSGETWANCKTWCESQNDGTCCTVLSGQDDDCAIHSGSTQASGSSSGNCTDYD